MRKKVKVDALLLEQLRATVERTRAEVDAGDSLSLHRFLGGVGWLSEELDRRSEEVPA